MRKIKIGLLIKNTLVYRTSVIFLETFIFYIFTKDVWLSSVAAVVLAIANTIYYFIYHYFFARLFKLGK